MLSGALRRSSTAGWKIIPLLSSGPRVVVRLPRLLDWPIWRARRQSTSSFARPERKQVPGEAYCKIHAVVFLTTGSRLKITVAVGATEMDEVHRARDPKGSCTRRP